MRKRDRSTVERVKINASPAPAGTLIALRQELNARELIFEYPPADAIGEFSRVRFMSPVTMTAFLCASISVRNSGESFGRLSFDFCSRGTLANAG